MVILKTVVLRGAIGVVNGERVVHCARRGVARDRSAAVGLGRNDEGRCGDAQGPLALGQEGVDFELSAWNCQLLLILLE